MSAYSDRRNRAAAKLHAEITANTDSFYADEISYAEHGRRNRALWDQIERRGLKNLVLKMIRDSEYRDANRVDRNT